MTSHSQAAVIVQFEQVGSDVVATWSGSIDAGSWTNDFTQLSATFAGANGLYGVALDYETYDGGSASVTTLNGTVDSFTGSAGFIDGEFFVAGVDDNAAPLSSIYDFDSLGVSQTFENNTLADIGADSFDNTLAWTSSAGGTNTISFTTVPEPSSTALLGLSTLGLLLRRHR